MIKCMNGLYSQRDPILTKVPKSCQPSVAPHVKTLKEIPRSGFETLGIFSPFSCIKCIIALKNSRAHDLDLQWCNLPRSEREMWASATQNCSDTSLIFGSSRLCITHMSTRFLARFDSIANACFLARRTKSCCHYF